MRLLWAIQPEWKNETAFVIGGGPSVAGQNVARLEGRKVIAVNSSYEVAPFADLLFFSDHRWWAEHCDRPALKAFKGRIATGSQVAMGDRLLRLRRDNPPPGFASDCRAIVCQWSSTQGAMNIAAHLGVKRIVLLGADMCRAPDGTSHHHSPHKWPNKPGNATWDIQMKYLSMIAEPLRERGIEVLNVSPVSRLTCWPKASLDDVLTEGV